jgi:hypothetical protein
MTDKQIKGEPHMTTNTMSAAQAAAKVDVDKSSIIRAIHAGKIDASKNEFGDWRIPPEQLGRYRRRNGPPQPPIEIEQRLARVSQLLSEALDELAAIKASRQ